MSDVMDEVIDDPAAITPGWVTEMLRRAGTDADIADLRVEPVGTGQMGTSYRVHLTSRDAAGPAPRSIVAKLAGGDDAARARVAGGYVKEIGFYRALADSVTVRRPAVWHAAIADDTMSFTLLLEDLCDSRPGVQADGCSAAQALAAVRNLAGLHAPRWNDPALFDHDFLTPATAESAALLGALLVDAADGFLERFSDEIDDTDGATLREAAAATAVWQTARPAPFALVHGDYRLDNLMFATAGDDVCALDWQMVSIGPPARDVAYFLGNSLLPDVRRAEEDRLVAAYHDALIDLGVTDYPADACWDDYRLGQLHGPMVTMLGCMFATAARTPASDEMFLAMARRSAAAIRDLDPFSLLP